MSRIYSFSKGFTYETFAKIIYIYIYQVATIIHAKSCIKSQIQEAHQNQQKNINTMQQNSVFIIFDVCFVFSAQHL